MKLRYKLYELYKTYLTEYIDTLGDSASDATIYILIQPSDVTMVGSLEVKKSGYIREAQALLKPVEYRIVSVAIENIRTEVKKFLNGVFEEQFVATVTGGVYATSAAVAFALRDTISQLYTSLREDIFNIIKEVVKNAVNEYVRRGYITEESAKEIYEKLMENIKRAGSLIDFLIAIGYNTRFTNVAVRIQSDDVIGLYYSIINSSLINTASLIAKMSKTEDEQERNKYWSMALNSLISTISLYGIYSKSYKNEIKELLCATDIVARAIIVNIFSNDYYYRSLVEMYRELTGGPENDVKEFIETLKECTPTVQTNKEQSEEGLF